MGDESIELDGPLPGLATKATITFMSPKHGLLGRSKPVGRVEADHAQLMLTFPDRTEERTLDLAGVDAYLAEVRAFQARVAERRAANEETRVEELELAATRVERSAAIRPSCPHCGVPRQYRGREFLTTAPDPSGLDHFRGAIDSPGYRPFEIYACPRCGSVELFLPAVLDHPLGG